jgi:hypothetical protein
MILSRTDEWCFAKSVTWGTQRLRNENPPQAWCLARHMRVHSDVPAPLIVLDNRDGHLAAAANNPTEIPHGFVLIEGHTRFSLAAALSRSGVFAAAIPVWLMRRRPSPVDQ